MDKMWAGRFQKQTDRLADDFNSSIRVDQRMAHEDLQGSMAHAAMLGAKGIIPQSEAEQIIDGLSGIADDLASGALPIDLSSEDIHMFIEAELTRRIGDAGRRLHTARSRNDQVAVDVRLYLRREAGEVIEKIQTLVEVLCDLAESNASVLMPGYTHLQRAQPVTFGHHLMAYAMMLLRDRGRFMDASRRMNECPLGSCALAGTTYDTDREMTAKALGFDRPTLNSMDGVSDRDFCVELAAACSLLMTHLSRFSEEVILWTSWEFRFLELDDAYSTGSSIMPQKKNPDMAELVRGKTGRVYGDLITLLTLLKGIPLAYNKDMQEDKEAVFDAMDTVKACLDIFAPMMQTARVHPERMRQAAAEGFINATDLADYLVRKGMPFRSAYKISGQLVAQCIQEGKTLETLPLSSYRTLSDLFDDDLYEAIDLDACVNRRISQGGPRAESVLTQVEAVRGALK